MKNSQFITRIIFILMVIFGFGFNFLDGFGYGYEEPLTRDAFICAVIGFVGSLGLLLELHHHYLKQKK